MFLTGAGKANMLIIKYTTYTIIAKTNNVTKSGIKAKLTHLLSVPKLNFFPYA